MSGGNERAIDAEVAEKVMGIKARQVRPRGCTDLVTVHTNNESCQDGQWTEHELCVYFAAPHYSTDIALADEIIERFEVGFIQIDNGYRSDPHVREWTCKIVAPGEEGEATAKTMPLAISLAALRAVGVTEQALAALKEPA